jgi:NAD+ synthase (glutamine-hydrolysing)
LPWLVGDQLYNAAAVCQQGKLLGVVPKSYLPTYKEFYEARWFTVGRGCVGRDMDWQGKRVPFGTDLLFADRHHLGVVVGVEICEDLWTPIPPSVFQALAGAKILVNLSASNEVIGKADYRRELVTSQSGRCIAGYVYASNGVTESTTDVVFGGHAFIAENGSLLAESPRFERESSLLRTDVDLQRLQNDRQKTNTFNDSLTHLQGRDFRRVPFALEKSPDRLVRFVDAHPFVPSRQEQLAERCAEIFHTQVAGLAKRLEHIGKPSIAIGVSGGLDSTHALIVAARACDDLKLPRSTILGFTMPGFATGEDTKGNAWSLMNALGIVGEEIDIRPAARQMLADIGHPFAKGEPVYDVTFENVQAGLRTDFLFRLANQQGGMVVGTGDLSEYALGWCTYNGDHISMYNPNVSIPKTLVKFLVRWAALNEFEGDVRKTLLDVVDTVISPELLPTAKDGGMQSTENVIGPYELHDFFLFHFLRYGAAPDKILYLAGHAKFDKAYSVDELRRWLKVFIQRFFTNQFKRSCLPDGPKVGTISISPRGDWRMPSDAEASAWLSWVDGG